MLRRIYLDCAATSWPKPPAVLEAIQTYFVECGVAVGRAATRRGSELQHLVDRCRLRAARLLGAGNPRRIIFTSNGTDALNLALHGLLHDGDHVVTTVSEHNSVLRPLTTLQRRRGVRTTLVGVDSEGRIRGDELAAAIEPRTRLIAVSHVSNVTGAIQPLAEIVAAAKAVGALVLVDAAQSAGHLPINVAELGIDLLACSGHKGLLGPLGTGLLYIAPGLERQLEPLRQGGTGSRSELPEQPEELPDKYEAGNHNAPGIVGLEAALAWIESQTVEELRAHEVALLAQLMDGLTQLPQVQVCGPRDVARRCGVVSITLEGYAPHEAAAVLDEHFGIEARAGLHCAPAIHHALGGRAAGGTLRLSPGPFSTADDIAAALEALAAMTAP